MSRAAETAAFTAWLGVETADGAKLPDTVIAALEDSFADGAIEDRDWPVDGAVLEGDVLKDVVALFGNFLDDGAKSLKTPVKAFERTKMERWFLARFLAPAKVEKEEAVIPPSKMLLDDMAVQGATAPWQLGWIELALASGRMVARAETAGFAHKAPWSRMDGGKTIVKYKQHNLDDLLEKGVLADLDTHFTTLAAALMEDDEPFSHKTAARVLALWQEARKLRSTRMIVYFLKRLRKKTIGRGIPFTNDPEISQEVTAAKLAGELEETTDFGAELAKFKARSGLSSATQSDASSMSGVSTELGSSVSSDGMRELLAAVGAIKSELTSLKTGIADVKSTTGSLVSKVTALERKGAVKAPTPKKEPKCWGCGETGHVQADCPNGEEE
jgi:hypothetical protein